jgi:hypothetical protein
MTLHYTYTVIYTEIYENNYILYTVYLYTHAVYHFDGVLENCRRGLAA